MLSEKDAYDIASKRSNVNSRWVEVKDLLTIDRTTTAERGIRDKIKSEHGSLVLSYKYDAPAIFVYGGVTRDKRKSGDYMYDYFGPALGDEATVFVAADQKVSGRDSFNWVMGQLAGSQKTKLNKREPKKKILYLFSGGWRPGVDFTPDFSDFDVVYLVDIWLGGDESLSKYLPAIEKNKGKVAFFYTKSGTAMSKGTEAVIKKSGAAMRLVSGVFDHMSINYYAVEALMNSDLV
jgi:hypothetical protein